MRGNYNLKTLSYKCKLIHFILQKNLQDKINQKRIQNCDFVQNLFENSWLSNLNNLQNLTQNKGR